MDQQSNESGKQTNPFHLTEDTTDKLTNPGYDTQTFGTLENGGATGSYDASAPSGRTGTYDAAGSGGAFYAAETATPAGMSPLEDKKAKSGMILGIVSLSLNLILTCVALATDYYMASMWVLIAAAVGLTNSIAGGKSSDPAKRKMAMAGKITSIIAIVWSALMFGLVLLLKIVNILD